uniref:MGAT4 conserved region domain-containing protein n=1 Tax=Glossina austeni TaxID=7395 RepID=A0A1A9V052_GLOAU
MLRKYQMLFLLSGIGLCCIVVLHNVLKTVYIKHIRISQRINSCQLQLRDLEATIRTKEEDIVLLSQYIIKWQRSQGVDLNGEAESDKKASLLKRLSPDIHKNLLNNVTVEAGLLPSVAFPTTFDFWPHLLNDPNSLRPALLISHNRSGAWIVFGIIALAKKNQSNLCHTLNDLIMKMTEEQQKQTLIVVFIGEKKFNSVLRIWKLIEKNFKRHLENGLIDVIAPESSYYVEFSHDSMTLAQRRTKQNQDYVYLMAYAHKKGVFYIQLNDNILFKTDVWNIIDKLIINNWNYPWIVMHFGRISKSLSYSMFETRRLPHLIGFIQMFYYETPANELLRKFVQYQDYPTKSLFGPVDEPEDLHVKIENLLDLSADLLIIN